MSFARWRAWYRYKHNAIEAFQMACTKESFNSLLVPILENVFCSKMLKYKQEEMLLKHFIGRQPVKGD